jgi:M6 family metalloprotease-like protein
MRKSLAVFLTATLTLSAFGAVTTAAFGKDSNQDPNIKVLPKSQRKPLTIARSCDERKGNCPKVNAIENTQDSMNCKIQDQTEDWQVSSGFPRNPDAILGKAKVDVLVMVFEFADKKFPDRAYRNLQLEAKKTEELYERISNGLIDLNMIFPKKEDWVRFPKNNADYVSMILSSDRLINLVLEQGSYLNPADYEAIYMHSPIGFSANNLEATENLPYLSNGKRVPRVYLAGGNVEGFGGYSHGLGHLLFYFEDIYDREKSGKEFHPSGTWDLMGAGGAFFGWFMYLNNWFTDEQVDCLPPSVQSSTHLLTPTSTPNGKKLIAITGDPGKLLLIEYRTGRVDEDLLSDGVCNTGACAGDRHEGLVIYFLDTTINHLKGPISVPERYYSKAMVTKERISFQGFKIEFLAKGRSGAYVRVGRA